MRRAPSLSRIFPRKATLTIYPRKLVFGPSGYTVAVTHEGLTYSAANGPRYLRLSWKMGMNVLTASLVNPMVAINWAVYFYPKGPPGFTNNGFELGPWFFPKGTGVTNGVKLGPRPTIVLWSSNDGFTLVYQR